MSDHDTSTTTYAADPELDWEEDELPRRPRRRLVTPLTGVLGAVVLAAAGFVGGVQVQKHQGGSGAGGGGGARAAGLAARFGGAAAGGGTAAAGANAGAQGGAPGAGSGQGAAAAGGGGAAATGTVANVKGKTLYVTTADGTTVAVKTTDNSKVTRNANASAAAIHPGDTVVVQGSKASSGTVTAASITAVAQGVSPFGGLTAFGGGGARQRGSGSSSVQVPQGFAPPSG